MRSDGTTTHPAASAAGHFAGGFAMVQDIVACLIAVAFAWAVAFQIGGEG
jgi:hypothetical protein